MHHGGPRSVRSLDLPEVVSAPGLRRVGVPRVCLGSRMAQREPVARIEVSLPMDRQECAISGPNVAAFAASALGN
jgi:hypothetical protein